MSNQTLEANICEVRDCYSEAHIVRRTEDCRIYADYDKTQQLGSGRDSTEAWADAVVSCTCECGHLKMFHRGGLWCDRHGAGRPGIGCDCKEFRSTRSPTRAIEGTYACPICGCATPHNHSPEQIAEWRMSGFARDLEKAPEFDGHISADVLERIKRL